MSKFKLSLVLVVMSVFSVPALAGEAVVKRVPTGAVAFHFVFDLSYITGEFVGYVAFIEGVDSPLFDGPPSKDTAHFTLRITHPVPPQTMLPVETDPALSTFMLMPGGQFTVFFNADPGPRDWNVPDTFSEGVPVAVFEESALLSTGASGTFGVFPGVFFNTFSSKLLDSAPIDFHDQRVDFRKLVPNGVTATNFGNVIKPDFTGAAGGGTAIAIGGELRDKSED